MSDETVRVAIYGKGGIGKSVIATGLSASFALKGLKVLHVGCDPKSDSAIRLVEAGRPIRTVLDVLGDDDSAVATDHVINRGRLGIDVCEAGGPPPGLGCGGRGVARTLEFFEDVELLEAGGYDVAVFDVLGDVVCGGFAAPLRQGFGDKVFIVVSEEPMAMYAANNITRAVRVYEPNGVALGGLVGNLKDGSAANREMLERFAALLSTRLIGYIPRDPQVTAAERRRTTVVEHAPDAPASVAFRALADAMLALDGERLPSPTPMENDAFYAYLEKW